MTIAVEIDRVSVVFGRHPERALPAMDAGQSRTEVLDATQQTLGVHDCSLSVAEGETLVLMGLSGSGKSTLLRTVNGLNPVVRGAVRVRDGSGEMVSITAARGAGLRELRLNRIAMVFQQFGLLPWRTVRDNIGLGLELAGLTEKVRRARVDEQLDLVGLTQWGDTPVTELSGGMQQRVGLARALVTQAPILLMDEPFSALDPLIRTRLQNELLELQSRLRRTIIFVSHDLNEAFRIGSRIAIMDGGRIIQTGTPRDIYTSPASDHVAAFVRSMNPLLVLTARDAMETATAFTAGEVDAQTPIRVVMARIGNVPLRVVEKGRTIGQVTRASLLHHLSHPGQPNRENQGQSDLSFALPIDSLLARRSVRGHHSI